MKREEEYYSEGSKLKGVLYLPDNSEENTPLPTIVLCHGFAGIKELLQIPDKWHTAAFVPIGYPVLGGHGEITRRPLSEMAFSDTFGNPLNI